jgi:Protein kinase domain
MSDTVRRIGGAVAAIACLAVGLAWGSNHAEVLRRAAATNAKSQARAVLAKATTELGLLAEPVGTQAQSLASLDALVGLMRGFDADDPQSLPSFSATLGDAVESESWTQNYRQVGMIAFTIGGQVIFATGKDRSLVGAAIEPLLAEAETSGKAAKLVFVGGAPMLAGLGRVPVTDRQQHHGVVVLIKPLDAATLSAVAQKTASTVMVTSEATNVSAGDAISVTQLMSFLHAGAKEEDPCCAVAPLGEGVQLGVWTNAAPTVATAEALATRDRAIAGAVGLVLAVAALLFSFRRSQVPEAHAQLLRDTTAELQKSREELKRLSQRISSSTGDAKLTPLSATALSDGLDRTSASVNGGRYEVVAPLGEGGMARVSVVQVRGAEGFRRLFVLKRLRPEMSGNAELVSQFVDEARLGAALVHSNIVPVFDFGRDDEGYYIAQEYILGRDVDALIQTSKARRNRALELPVVLMIAGEALKALSYAHSKKDDQGRPMGLVHRDVSPNNLMVSARGELKLLDFGIVKSEQRLTRTQTGVVKGNLYFMSPEQARALPVDPRSDLFSLALVIFSAITGDTLYSGQTNYELLTRCGGGLTADDQAKLARLPSPLNAVLTKALQFEPNNRFADADEFARAIASCGTPASSTDMQALMEWLFRDELAAETNRFVPPT